MAEQKGFSSFMAINPETKSGVIILTNRAMKPVHKLGIQILQEIERAV